MVWNWYGIGMEWYGILWNSMDQLELHKNGLSSIISPLQAAVLKTSDTGVLVELHGISVLQLDTGTCFTAHTSNFTFLSVTWFVGQPGPSNLVSTFLMVPELEK